MTWLNSVLGRSIRDQDDIALLESADFSEIAFPTSIYEAMAKCAVDMPERTAILALASGSVRETPLKVSYRDLFRNITRCANVLLEHGVRQHSVVTIILPNIPQYFYALWGAQTVAIAQPLNPLSSEQAMLEVLQQAQPQIVITVGPSWKDLWDKVSAVVPQITSVKHLLTVDMDQYHTKPVQLWRRAMRLPRTHKLRLPQQDFDQLLLSHSDENVLTRMSARPDDVSLMVATQGAMGHPQLVCLSQLNQLYNVWAMRQYTRLGEHDVLLAGLPMSHVVGAVNCALAPLMAGSTILLAGALGYSSKGVQGQLWRLIERFRVSVCIAPPYVVQRLNQQPVRGVDIRSLRYVISVGSGLSQGLQDQFEQRTDTPIIQAYSLTEASGLCALNPPFGEPRLGAAGLRVPYQQIKSIKLDEQGHYLRDSHVDEVGHIVLKGPGLFRHYRDQQQNRDVWMGDGWYASGDLGYHDEDGFIWLVGREQAVIRRGGRLIFPLSIEHVISQHMAVEQVVVVAKPDKYWGQVAAAYVVLRPGYKGVQGNELQRFASQHLDDSDLVPDEVVILECMPCSAEGHIYRSELRQTIYQKTIASELQRIANGDKAVEVQVQAPDNRSLTLSVELSGDAWDQMSQHQVVDVLQGYRLPFQLSEAGRVIEQWPMSEPLVATR